MQACLLSLREPALCAPLTSNRDLGDCLIANVPLRDLLSTELKRSGFQVVLPHESNPKTLRIPMDHWVEIGALIMLGRSNKPACLYDEAGNLLAWKGGPAPEDCTEKLVTHASCFRIRYPWDLLHLNEEVLQMIDEPSIIGEINPLAQIDGRLRLGAGSRVLSGVVIEGNVVIGANTQIGPNAYIRGATSIGNNCFVGNGAEVKNSIIYHNSYVSRNCYVGDSIVGSHVTLGAGTVTENHRHDGRPHTSVIHGKPVNTGRLKFGAIIGDGVKTGVNTSLEAGVKIGIGRTTRPGSYVGKDVM
jgi:acetyltransferase-like isoleucine patch superfamily enzyme